MTKKSAVLIIVLLLFSIFIGCSTVKSSTNSNESQRLASVEIYSVSKQTLVDTIEDKEILATFNKNTSFVEQWDDTDNNYMEQQAKIKKKSEEYEVQYIFILYKTPAAINNDGTLEKQMEITIYKDTNIIKEQISSDNIKNILVPSEYLTFYFETSDEVIQYLYSLIPK